MKKYFFSFLLISHFFSVISVPGDSLFFARLDLSESVIKKVVSLNPRIIYQQPDVVYHRETVEFGTIFHELEKGRRVEKPMPQYIKEIREQLFEQFKDHLDVGDVPENYDNCIITFYKTGDGISLHRDRSYFDNCIMGLIIEPDSKQSLYFEDPSVGETSRFFLDEKSGTAFLFKNELRNEWKHGLLPIQKRRISITFRKVLQVMV